jgi:ribosome-associated protein
VLKLSLAPKALARTCCKLALDKKAKDVVIIDLRKLNAPTDYFVICSGVVDRQIKAIADNIIEGTAEKGYKPWHVEGYGALRWVLIDYVDVVVHVFNEETRGFYSLETLWGDAPLEKIEAKMPRTRKK